ncbi:MAG TPA: pantoate--beta-alanine ligase [Actinomycetota bacterium]
MTRTVAAARSACDAARSAGRSVGFVPTMGALHAGHESLVRMARAECGFVVVSIFVNPLQFGPSEDFASYPRDEDGDLRALEAVGADAVFLPAVEEMEPVRPPEVMVDPGSLAERLEGAFRPGHFRGVATVVAKLFNIVGPCRAYFGEKDAQQLAVMRRLVRDLVFPVEIVGCPTVREPDGLAMSSRNAYLSPEEREAADCLLLALSKAAEMVRGGERDAARLVAVMARVIGSRSVARIDYVAVVDEGTFEEVRAITGPARAVVAARFGHARLIDNLALPLP